MDTAIQRSWTKTIVWSGLGLAFGGAGGWLCWWAATGEGARLLAWLPAIVLLMIAVPCFAVARSLSGHAGCPHCGESLAADSTELLRSVQCRACLEHARVVGNRLEKLPDDWVDAQACFTATVPLHEIHWPGCAMCGAPPTRSRVHDHHVPDTTQNIVVGAVGLATAGLLVTSEKIHRLSVPYCDEHDDCVELDWESGRVLIRFRSLAVYQAFRAANSDRPSAP